MADHVKRYADMDSAERTHELDALMHQYDSFVAKKLSLNMARGKPSSEQLDLSIPMLSVLRSADDCFSECGADCRNYGILDGIPEAKRLLAYLLDDEPANVIVFGNSSLTVMHDTIARCLDYGCLGSTPWAALEEVKFICPVPGYDRHFAILEQFGIRMLPVAMTETGPDMDEVEKLASSDASIKGIWCVPKYSNPTGATYSDDTVRRLAQMECAAPDFRIFWDNAYCVHDLYPSEDQQDQLLDIGASCAEAGNPDRYYKFASTSKITFPGAGIAGFASSAANVNETKRLIATQMIGSDKLNQLRHVRFLPDDDAIDAHMGKQADIIRPKFELVWKRLESELNDLGIAEWTYPKGGYFISFTGVDGTAQRTVQLAADAGVVLTNAGATYPYGKDPNDSNIRIAPTMPTLEELDEALDVFCCCAKIAALEALEA